MRFIILILFLLPQSLQGSYFASIKSNKANMRIGPSTDYPIEWVYIQKNLPVQVLEKYEQWRKIQDIEGSLGWMHQSLLSSKHYFIVTAISPIHDKAEEKSKIKAYVDPQVIGKLIKCEGIWCKVKIESITGWIKKDCTWGIKKN